MESSTFYTAVGHFRRKTDGTGQSYPVILINQEEYLVDIQEMCVWTILSWPTSRPRRSTTGSPAHGSPTPPAPLKPA